MKNNNTILYPQHYSISTKPSTTPLPKPPIARALALALALVLPPLGKDILLMCVIKSKEGPAIMACCSTVATPLRSDTTLILGRLELEHGA
jgi:hypothetical protein